MNTLAVNRLVPTAVAAAAIACGALLTVAAPTAHASPRSDCEGKGGTYTETTITDNKTGKIGISQSCCVKDTATNTTSCTNTTITQASRVPLEIGPGVITAAETVEPTKPIQRVPLGVLDTAE